MKVVLIALCLISLSSAIVSTEGLTGDSTESMWSAVFPIDPEGTDRKDLGHCTATLITTKHAVTAMSCFYYADWYSFTVDFAGVPYSVSEVYFNRCFDDDAGNQA
jgi:hypothetical protein